MATRLSNLALPLVRAGYGEKATNRVHNLSWGLSRTVILILFSQYLAEEGGFIASVSLLLLYALLFWRLTILSLECPYERDQLAIVGVLCLIAFQVIVNIGVTLGLAPVTGITLPLVSYGGTSLLSTLAALGLVFVIHRDRYKDW